MRHTIVLLLTACALVLGGAPAGAAAKIPTKVRGFTAATQTVAPGGTATFKVKVTAKGKASARRTVVLQRRAGSRWVKAATARTNKYGRVVLRYRAATKTGTTTKLRVRVTAKGRLRAANSPVKKVVVRAAWTPDALSRQVLTLVNQARSQEQDCGKAGTFPARGPLRLEAKLTAAARLHAVDMAAHDDMTHTGSNGSSLRDRIDAQKYVWSSIGENVAKGYPTAAAVVAAWMDSDGHCANIMDTFTELGVGYALSDEDLPYWVQDFGTPR